MINSIELPATGTYSDVNVCSNSTDDITDYYFGLLSGLNLNKHLSNEEKIGQLAFLIKEWQAELALDMPNY